LPGLYRESGLTVPLEKPIARNPILDGSLAINKMPEP